MVKRGAAAGRQLEAEARTALAGSWEVDDVQQLFANGRFERTLVAHRSRINAGVQPLLPMRDMSASAPLVTLESTLCASGPNVAEFLHASDLCSAAVAGDRTLVCAAHLSGVGV